MSLKGSDHFRKNCLFFAVLLAAIDAVLSQAAANAAPAANATAPACNLELIQLFGLKGSATPLAYPMDLCPTMVDSCCQPADQKIIFELWTKKNISGNIDFTFSTYEKVYDSLFQAIGGLQLAITDFYKLNKNKPASECLVFARKLTFFDFASVQSKLMDSMKLMHAFFKQSYKSFYCSICDASLQKYFDVGQGKVSYSKGFCRAILQKSVPNLLYLHGHLRKYINLINKFALSCNAFGNFKNVTVPFDRQLKLNESLMANLTLCKQARNSPKWFDYCVPVCEQFNFTSHSRFFAPFMNQFLNTTVYMKQLLTDFQKSGTNNMLGVLSMFGPDAGTQPRALAEQPKTANVSCPLDICLTEDNYVVIPVANGTKMKEFAFKPTFVNRGIPVDYIAKQAQMIEVSDARIQLMSNPSTASQAQATKADAKTVSAGGAATAAKSKAASTAAAGPASSIQSGKQTKSAKSAAILRPTFLLLLAWIGFKHTF